MSQPERRLDVIHLLQATKRQLSKFPKGNLELKLSWNNNLAELERVVSDEDGDCKNILLETVEHKPFENTALIYAYKILQLYPNVELQLDRNSLIIYFPEIS